MFPNDCNPTFDNLKCSRYAGKKLRLTFLFKEAKELHRRKKDPIPIYLRITVDGVPKELSTKRLWYSNKWNPHAGRAAGNKEDVKSLNAYLDVLQSKVYDTSRILLERGEVISSIAIKNILSGQALRSRTLINLFKNPITITRQEVMSIARIGGQATYHKCMKDLVELGYIEYVPSFNPALKTLV